MEIVFLASTAPLTKGYTKQPDNTIKKTPYPMTWEFTSHHEQCKSIADLHAALLKHAALGHCLLKGLIAQPLVAESRAGSTKSNDATEWIVLDLDGLPDTYKGATTTVDVFLTAVGLSDFTHIIQWSASYGIENKKLRAHIFFLLDKAAAAPQLKQTLIQLNHDVPMLNESMSLTATGNAVSWALDISACQNDKLIYIAPPVLRNIKDPVTGPRITLVKRKFPRASLTATVNSPNKNAELTHKRLDELRAAAGLTKRKTTYKMHGSVEVLAKPDHCIITEMKQDRGFVYFNLNGGDSWAYYHPETNPDYIFNFKGEPAYLTKELLPDYWNELTKAGSRTNSAGLAYLAFCDRNTSSYWRGTYDQVNDKLDLFAAKNETQLRDFAKQHGLPIGDFIPEWDMHFDPHDSVRVDFTNKTINQFQLTQYMKAQARQIKACPKTILKIMSHVLGDDPVVVEHFINWIATILQLRDRVRTSWLWHGVPGTGKGIFFNRILRPIFGELQTSAQNMETLNEPYNHWMQNSFLIFVDEVQMKALDNKLGAAAKLRNYITEKFVQVRAMYQSAREVRNYTNWIMASNMADAIIVDNNDRRTNVAKYQPNKLIITDKELEQIDKELQSFHDFLLYYPIDKERAATPLDTSDRRVMISISESSVDTVGSAIIDGRFGFLMEQLPNSTTSANPNALEFNKTENYKQVLSGLLARTDRNTGVCNIARDELRVIFDYVVGGMPTTPNKFTSLLKHHRIHIADVWINNGNTATAGKERGLRTVWTDLAQWVSYQNVFTPPTTTTKSLKTKSGKNKLIAVI